ncbi:MAG: phospholipid carrier-dependent glycosyltransferase [Clostridia bacterium]|nr:phospholipid carrier-dependent glycosyltransferase [Clostridia bacterium]
MKPSFILALIFGAFFWFLYQDQNNRLQKENTTRKLGSSCFWILGIATLIKIILAPHFKGYEVDMNTYSAWMQRAAQGLNGFYADGYFCDYPPLYIMMTGFFGWICKLFGGGDYLTKLFVKMPGIIAEGLIAYEVLKLYNRHYPKAKQSTFAVMLALWPSFLVTGTYWGQTDSIFCYLMLLTIRFVMEDKLTLSALLFTLSALTKPQSFLFAPLFAILFAKSDSLVLIPNQKDNFPKAAKIIWNLVITFLFSLAIMSISMIPFRGGVPDLPFLIQKYTETFSSYPYASLNTFNLFGLLGGNMVELSKPFLFLTYEKWGTIFMAVCVAAAMVLVWKNKKKENLWLIFGTYLFAIVMLGSKMHERYWYFVPVLMLLYFIASGKKNYFGIASLLCISYFMNLVFALDYLSGVQDPFNRMLFVCFTLINLAVLVYLIRDCFQTVFAEDAKPQRSVFEYSQTFTWKSAVALLLVMIVFGGSAYYRLGSTKNTPQTYAKVSKGDSVVFHFDEPKTLSEIRYFSGYGLKNYKIRCTGPEYNNYLFLSGKQEKSPYVFSWQKEQAGNIFVSSVTLEVQENGSDAVTEWGEFAFYDEAGNYIPYHITASAGVDVAAFSDEPYTVPDVPSYENSFYFDEIYHGRTAYEYVNGLSIYETTHPPLGKLLMTIGISLFGWNMLGVRFMGVLFGILMIPLFYLLSKRLLKYNWIALLTTIVFSFDFMHLSHSRIASIDAFMVFFILAAFTFMVEFLLEYEKKGLSDKAKVWLGISGAMFGCGAAVKWAAIYAGIGLCAVYIYAIVIRYKKSRDDGEIGKLILWSLGLYALLPFAIYYFSYIPYFTCFRQDLTWQSFWGAQKHMFSYHSGLTATHPYSAAWYDWIIDLRPLWMHQGVLLESGNRETIATMSNPVLIWGGLAALIYTLVWCVKEKKLPLCAFLIFAGYFSQILPWMLVSRVTFTYHYFPMLAFLALALGFYWKNAVADKGKRLTVPVAACVIAVALFFVYFPVLTGIVAPQKYIDILKIIPNWTF